MHLYLWASLAGSCLLYPGLSLLGGGDGGCSGENGVGIDSRRRSTTTATATTAVMAFAAAPQPPRLLARRQRSSRLYSPGTTETTLTGLIATRQQQCSRSSSSNNNNMQQQRRRRQPASAAAAAAAGTPRSHLLPLPPSPSWRLYAARRVNPDDDDDDYDDRGRTDPPTMASGRPPVRGNAPASRGRGRPGSGAGRGVGGRNNGGESSPAASADRGGGGRGRGIDQSDPLVRDWNSAKVLAGEVNGGRGGGGRGERRYVQDSAGRGGRGRGRGRGRGGGRGRGRGYNKTPVGMYVGSDTVPWYIKEVQDKGLDTQGEFSRWWQSNLDPEANAASVKGMKVTELKAQLARMDLPTTGLKTDLAERLSAAYLRCSLSDDNFQHAQVTDVSANDEDLPNCFPEVYEKATEAELEKLWRQSRQKKRGK